MPSIEGLRCLLVVANGWLRTDPLDIRSELGWVGLDAHDVVTPCGHDGLSHRCWSQQRLHRDHTARQHQLAQHRLDGRDRVGLIRHGLLGQCDAHLGRQGREPVDPWSTLLARAPERFAIERHRRFSRLGSVGSPWRARHDTLGPRPQLRLEPHAVQTPKHQVECRRTRRDMRNAERLGETRAIMASPCGDGARATRPTEHGTTGQRQNCRQGMPCAASVANVWNVSQHFKSRTGMWSHA